MSTLSSVVDDEYLTLCPVVSLCLQKRDQKNQSEKMSASLQNRVKASETQNTSLRSQNDTLKRMNDDLGAQLKAEREAKHKEAEQREAAQRQLRQLNTKTRISSSQQESMQKQLRDRDDEIKRLRQLLVEARQRSTSSLIPRMQMSSSPPMKKSRSSRAEASNEPDNNQLTENGAAPTPQSKALQSRSGSARKPLSTRGTTSSARSPSVNGQADDASVTDESPSYRRSSSSSRLRSARTPAVDSGLPRWK